MDEQRIPELSELKTTERRSNETEGWKNLAKKLAQELANRHGGTFGDWLEWANGMRAKPERKARKSKRA